MAKKVLKGYRTVLVNAPLVAIPLLDQIISNGALIGALTPYAGQIVAAAGLINILLRAVTNTPIGKKES